MKLTHLLWGFGMAALSGCAWTSPFGAEEKFFDYQLTDRNSGCTTGYHAFYSHQSFCETLAKDSSNKNCALAERKVLYEVSCADNWLEIHRAKNELVASYEFQDTDHNCTTGYHAFYQEDRYCKALVSDVKNHSCAFEKRKSTYLRDCGTDWKTQYSRQK